MAKPGPGQVIKFARDVGARRHGTDRTNGMRAALSWALGESDEHPLTGEIGKGGPPDMRVIAKVAREADLAAKRPSRSVPVFSRDYCRGVADCLSWIHGRRHRQP